MMLESGGNGFKQREIGQDFTSVYRVRYPDFWLLVVFHAHVPYGNNGGKCDALKFNGFVEAASPSNPEATDKNNI